MRSSEALLSSQLTGSIKFFLLCSSQDAKNRMNTIKQASSFIGYNLINEYKTGSTTKYTHSKFGNELFSNTNA